MTNTNYDSPVIDFDFSDTIAALDNELTSLRLGSQRITSLYLRPCWRCDPIRSAPEVPSVGTLGSALCPTGSIHRDHPSRSAGVSSPVSKRRLVPRYGAAPPAHRTTARAMHPM